MGKEILAARGAICIPADDAAAVDTATERLLSAIAQRNGIAPADCIFLLFSTTSDIRSRNPATAARAAGWNVPLFCVREADFDDAPELVIRVLVAFRAAPEATARHAYLDGAEKLRPDIAVDSPAPPLP